MDCQEQWEPGKWPGHPHLSCFSLFDVLYMPFFKFKLKFTAIAVDFLKYDFFGPITFTVHDMFNVFFFHVAYNAEIVFIIPTIHVLS